MHGSIVTPLTRPESEQVADLANVVPTDDRLCELARRCGELLALKTDACPPGHWLG
jgi:hypothetical protein